MATTLLDAFQTTSDAYPANFAISAGSNRRAYLAVIRTSGTNAAPATSASIGGVSVSALAVADLDDGTTTLDVVIALFEWTESQIASMSGTGVSVTGGSGANFACVYWSVQDATQSAITPVASGIAAALNQSLSLARVADSLTCVVTVHDISSGAYSSLANPAQTGTFAITNGVIAYGAEADTERTANFTWSHASSRENATVLFNIAPAATGATISSGTPSGTIGTQRRVTLGATSTQSTGTFYAVVSSNQADITGITAAQVFAGQYAGGGSATFAGNAAVSDSTPSVEITGLTPATTYYYAVMHRVGTSNSNVLDSGSFTTAVATSTATLTLRDGAGALLNAQTLNFWTRTGLNTVAVDGGTSGLSVTCDASGVFTFTGLSVDAGAGFLTVQNPSDNTYSANYPVTFVAGV